MRSRAARAPSRSTEPANSQPTSTPTLPAWKAFVVQFSAESGAASGIFAGRVEHLNTTRRARFASLQDLLVVLQHLLAEIKETAQ